MRVYAINILVTVMLLVFDFNSDICDYYAKDVEDWWTLRTNIYSLMFFVSFLTGLFIQTYYSRTILVIGLIYCFGDVVDRIFFNINKFHINDMLIYISSLTYIAIRYARKNKTNT